MAIFRTFGSNPSGKELEKIKTSPNYRDRVFQNLSHTEQLAKGASMLKIMWRFFNKPKNTEPPIPLPSSKTDLLSFKSDKPFIIWFGHSSYFIHINGKNILVDPVFCGYASPFSFTGHSFKGADIYTADDFPAIDILILTHDHYDHLDYKTVVNLSSNNVSLRPSTSFSVLYFGSALQKCFYNQPASTIFSIWSIRICARVLTVLVVLSLSKCSLIR
jgi:hypothetical protein